MNRPGSANPLSLPLPRVPRLFASHRDADYVVVAPLRPPSDPLDTTLYTPQRARKYTL